MALGVLRVFSGVYGFRSLWFRLLMCFFTCFGVLGFRVLGFAGVILGVSGGRLGCKHDWGLGL